MGDEGCFGRRVGNCGLDLGFLAKVSNELGVWEDM